MSKHTRPIKRAKKNIRKVVTKNPIITASLVALGGLATYVARSQRVRDRTRGLKDSVMHRLSGAAGATHGQEAPAAQAAP